MDYINNYEIILGKIIDYGSGVGFNRDVDTNNYEITKDTITINISGKLLNIIKELNNEINFIIYSGSDKDHTERIDNLILEFKSNNGNNITLNEKQGIDLEKYLSDYNYIRLITTSEDLLNKIDEKINIKLDINEYKTQLAQLLNNDQTRINIITQENMKKIKEASGEGRSDEKQIKDTVNV